MKNFIEELKWRGMLSNIMPGTEEQLQKEITAAYIGFDPTADSLHLGSMLQITLLMRFQQCGHKPIALVGGATGMIGDPSGKAEERKLLSIEQLRHNEEGIRRQLEKFLDFDCGENSAELVNNKDWFGNMNMIHFLRDVGKFLTVNYLLSKGFVKDRISGDGELSFTEFNYILMQAYDFMWLYENKKCLLQMGGSDQWGNITAGNELIRKKLRGEAYALTVPLVTKSDGSKFGKSERGNIWLDPQKTSPYRFYQFLLNAADDDVEKLMCYFSMKGKEEIEQLTLEHNKAKHQRILQRALAEELTIRVHSKDALASAIRTSQILFGNDSIDAFKSLNPADIEEAIDDDAQFSINQNDLMNADIVSLMGERTTIFPSKGEARKMILGNGVSVNKEKISLQKKITPDDLLFGKYLLVQKGKKNYYLIKTLA